MKKYLKGQSLFQLIDQKRFNALVKKWEMDKWVQAFDLGNDTSIDQLFCDED